MAKKDSKTKYEKDDKTHKFDKEHYEEWVHNVTTDALKKKFIEALKMAKYDALNFTLEEFYNNKIVDSTTGKTWTVTEDEKEMWNKNSRAIAYLTKATKKDHMAPAISGLQKRVILNLDISSATIEDSSLIYPSFQSADTTCQQLLALLPVD